MGRRELGTQEVPVRAERGVRTWFLYVVLCSDGTLYTGVTTDLDRRLRQHNGDLVGGAKYTRARRPVTLQAFWLYPGKSPAMKAEHEFKKLSRAEKLRRVRDRSLSDAANQNY